MLLSFSVDSMRPMIKSGLRQRAGEDVGADRVKRQTIRARGPRAEKLLDHAKNSGWTIPYDLHLWWKSRTPGREFLGKVEPRTGLRVAPLQILHSTAGPFSDGKTSQCLRIVSPDRYAMDYGARGCAFWSPGDPDDSPFSNFARADGFDSVEAFRDFFVPNLGDVFEGILFKW